MRPLLTRFLLLVQAVAVIGAQQAAQGDDAQNGAGTQTDMVAEQRQPEAREPGAELVDAALRALQAIPPSSYSRGRGQSGVVGMAFQYIIDTIPTGPVTGPSTDRPVAPANDLLLSAVEYLERAAYQNNSDALYLLADMNFFGNYSHPRDLHAAFGHYQQLATAHGNTTAQYMLGLYHSTGIGNVVPRDQAKALLYFTFAAIRGDMRAEMATAFRHHAGIGATKSCETAIRYYKRVADKAMEWYRSGPPGGRTWVRQGWRISDENGGVYGEGASVSSAGINAFKPSPNSDANAAISDVIEYLDLMSQKGDFKASFNLGRIYYEGQRGLPQNIPLARRYFLLVTTKYWKKDGRVVENFKPGIEKVASKAAGYIGWMYLRGEFMPHLQGEKAWLEPESLERARVWLERGIAHSDAQSQYALGLMHLNGYGVKENVKKAMDLFKAASDQDFAPAQVQMGRLYLDQGGQEDVRHANNYFELAVRHGNIEAAYYLGEMINHGVGRERLCGAATSYYKSVVEKTEPIISSWADANDAYEYGDRELAFLEYLMAAEQGYEKAQTNIAYMIDSARSTLPMSQWFGKPSGSDGFLANPALALIYWTRSSRQSNTDALVKMGDYYFYGIGAEVDLGKAVQCYTGASDYSQSAQALFNLGWMHENGVGLTQDFHLAKRFYDSALEVNAEAYLPVTLSLLKLRMRSAWNTLTNGPIHSIQDEPKPDKDWSISEWIANFLQDDNYYDDDSLYSDDLYDGGFGTGDDDLDDGGILESFLIIGVTMSLLLLLWWRQRMQQNHARDQAARQDGQGQGHVPQPPQPPPENRPNAGDPFQAWAAGGMGL